MRPAPWLVGLLILVAVVGSVTVLGAVLPASMAFSPVQGLVWLGVAGLGVVSAALLGSMVFEVLTDLGTAALALIARPGGRRPAGSPHLSSLPHIPCGPLGVTAYNAPEP